MKKLLWWWKQMIAFVTGAEPLSMRDAVNQMEDALDARASLTAERMQKADDAYDDLNREVRLAAELNRQAEAFLRKGERQAAERCLSRKLEADGKIAALTKRYEEAQQRAEAGVSEFNTRRAEVEQRRKALPELERTAEQVAREEALERRVSSFTARNPHVAFDQMADEVRRKQGALDNRSRLSRDPNDALDRQIRDALDADKLARAMGELEAKVNAGVIEGEIVESPAELAAGKARELLEAPRYQGLLAPAKKVPVSRGGEER